jgi:benzoyl-CoA reductase/2-hydroxyglutaryl-CoA dehydratase subunit BcrC/BadD/HgdB
MNYYETEVIKLQKRIKRIEENPDQTKLQSNKLRYELQLEQSMEQLEAWKSGKPFSDGGGFTAGTLARAMGFAFAGSSGAVFGINEANKYIDIARTRGLPTDNTCDMTSIPFAIAECGEVPVEDMFICDQHACTPMMLAGIFLSHSQKPSSYFIDMGFEENERNLKYVTDQLGEFIEYCESHFPGIKYNEDKLIELQEMEEKIRGYYYDIYEFRKNKPSPIAGKDAFQLSAGVGISKKAVEYYGIRRDEVAERAAKGIAAVPGEKLRVIWTVTRPFFMDPFEVLAKKKTAVLLHYSGPVAAVVPIPQNRYWGERQLKPLEKVAAHAISSLWAGTGDRWVSNMMWICKDLKIDGIINYCMLGCSATLGLKRMVEEAAQKELGIPVLQLEGSQWNKDYAGEETITNQLNEFVDMCLNMKGN